MIDLKGILLCLAFPVLPFVGTTLTAMFYQFVLSLVDRDYDLRESFKQCAAFAFKPTMYLYFFIWFCIVAVLMGADLTAYTVAQ